MIFIFLSQLISYTVKFEFEFYNNW